MTAESQENGHVIPSIPEGLPPKLPFIHFGNPRVIAL